MSGAGILGSMCFPSFPRFCGQFFAEATDEGLATATVQAYNDWHIEAWAGAYPDRFIPLAIPMMWSAEASAKEMRRVARKGCHAVTFSENPAALGLPSMHNDYWDPFWGACDDEGIRVCMHIGSSSQTPVTAPDAPVDVTFVLSPVSIMSAAADVLFSRVLREHRQLKFVLSEGGIGWIPYFLERVDYVYARHHAWTGADFGGRLPSEVFRERFLTCFVDDAFGIESFRHMNLDHVMWECDYPHADSVWPGAPELLEQRLAGVPDDVVNKVTHENVMRELSFDPFSVRPKEASTVAALRDEVVGHDVSIRATGSKPHRRSVTGGELHSRFKPQAPVNVAT
jgi:predicted TIM-barrel fold metal-dependent hydrolase